jgi:tetratricopeptide (TPR) repeat protein
MIAKTPEKPQAHYILGYLRKEQGRFAEALTHFRDAVKLDPDYINAWSEMQSLSQQIVLPPADNDAAVLNTLRLIPSSLSVNSPEEHFNIGNVYDLKALWQAVETLGKEPPQPLPMLSYPLPASKAALEKAEAEALRGQPQNNFDLEEWRLQTRRSRYAQTSLKQPSPFPYPAQVIADQSIFSALGNVLTQQAQSEE